jgi:ubiquinone/menaquinone biosynthesis C-methylase UbiE
MPTVEELLKNLEPPRVLDVATGPGNFIHFLKEHLGSFREIIGIDTSEKAQAAFKEAFKDDPRIRFEMRDAAQLDYPDASFDMVCISNSLHHMADPGGVLNEMLRVLKPQGTLLISEMYRDNQSKAQMTHVLMHDWWGAVNTAQGIVHNETFTRQQVLELISGSGLIQVATQDLSDLSDDPKDPETIKHLAGVTDEYFQRLAGLPGEETLRARGLELRRRLDEVGFHSATTLLVLGKKP